jgi:hypothetical protein
VAVAVSQHRRLPRHRLPERVKPIKVEASIWRELEELAETLQPEFQHSAGASVAVATWASGNIETLKTNPKKVDEESQ